MACMLLMMPIVEFLPLVGIKRLSCTACVRFITLFLPLITAENYTQWSWFSMPQCCRIAPYGEHRTAETEVKLEFTGGFVPEVPDPDDHDDTVQARPWDCL